MKTLQAMERIEVLERHHICFRGVSLMQGGSKKEIFCLKVVFLEIEFKTVSWILLIY